MRQKHAIWRWSPRIASNERGTDVAIGLPASVNGYTRSGSMSSKEPVVTAYGL